MAYGCPKCGMRLKLQPKSEIRKYYSYKVLVIESKRRYKCPAGCTLDRSENEEKNEGGK